MHTFSRLMVLGSLMVVLGCDGGGIVEGPQGEQGEPGPVGPQGAPGKAGKPGAAGAAGGDACQESVCYESVVVVATPSGGGEANAVASCLKGDRYVAGFCQFGKVPIDRVTAFRDGALIEYDGDAPILTGQQCWGFSDVSSYVEAHVVCTEAD